MHRQSAGEEGGPRADRVYDLLLHLETAAARAVVHCVLSGRSFLLTPEEARLTSRCIAFEDRRRATGWLASLFETAACDAEAMAASAGAVAR